ncbi:MAG: acyl-CoA synthetase FdrA, partial [Anaerolineales bacterium]|nr:acyl-CoA synthetase FdrA [Anaerolineales bacterium]
TYFDSAVLMQLQKGLTELEGVEDAGAVMATRANCELLADNNLLPGGEMKAGPDDLLIVIRAVDESSAAEALDSVDDLLARRPSAVLGEFHPRSIETALESLPQAQWVLVSVPGRYAAGVVEQALDLRRNVFLYSDNVPLEEEVRLKKQSRDQNLLVMGPDCGTAIVNGTGFGFANIVSRGNIGIVGASGTGVQAVTVGVDRLGGGISHALGTGGRDLKPEVGGVTALQGLELLSKDAATEVIVFISKPPDPEVAARLLRAARSIPKPVVVNFIGHPAPTRRTGNIYYAINLSEAAALAVDLARSPAEEAHRVETGGGFLRGLFSGGTLAYEAVLSLQGELSPLRTNIPLRADQEFDGNWGAVAHLVIDLGEDEYTAGRLHPMIDNDLRLKIYREQSQQEGVGLLFLDIVLGEGAHPDPASEFAPAIERSRAAAGPETVVLLLGTDQDQQNISDQRSRLERAGARVFQEYPDALAYVARRLEPVYALPDGMPLDSIYSPVAAVNVGLESFYASLKEQGAEAIHVDWKPPAGGNE